MRAADVRAALAKKFALPEYAIFWEVGEGTGAQSGRYADAVAMSLWPSRGCELAGFEIKVSRSDWLNELRQPTKSLPIQQHMDRWWVVTPPDIIRPGELPPTWGHYVVKGNGMNCAVMAPKLDSIPVSRHFLAALLRRSAEHAARSTREGIDAAMTGERAAIESEITKRVDRALDVRRSTHTSAVEKLEAIQRGCGLEPERYLDGEGFGRAIGIVHKLGVAGTYHALTHIRDRALAFGKAYDELLPSDVLDDAS